MKKKILKEEKNITIDGVENIAKYMKSILKDGDIIVMQGNLGFGKTTFVRTLSKILGSKNIVSSPSFTLINEYDIILNNIESILKHIDLYRINSIDELDNIGFRDKIKEEGITIIEWGDKFIDYFESPYYLFEIEMLDENSRSYRISLIL